jgi:hypothetical protein
VTHYAGDDRAALPFLQRAIQLDPNFAMAHAKLLDGYFITLPARLQSNQLELITNSLRTPEEH